MYMIFNISPTIVWIIFSIALLVAIIASAVLLYHWKSYGMGDERIRKGERLYFLGLAFFFMIATIFATVLTTHL